jgi:hypothetical protein
MSSSLTRFVLSIGLSCIPLGVIAQEKPLRVSSCELAKNPKNFDGKQIRVRGRLNVHFEDFTLGIMNCNSTQGIWLAFGGDVPGIVASTANDNFRKPGSNFVINGRSLGIKKDNNFLRLYALITSRHGNKRDYKVTATLTGTFFSGEETKNAQRGTSYMGYGHLGCCSLLVVTQVAEVESVPSADLQLRGTVTGPDGRPIEGLTVIDDMLGGSPPERQTTVANQRGEFAFPISGQQLRIESSNYRPLALTVKPGGAPVRVQLQDARLSDWVLAACGEADSERQIGFSVRFSLPPTEESSRSDSEDSQTQSFFVFPKGRSAPQAELIISHDDYQTNDAGDSLDSEWFQERWVKDGAGNIIGMDARGRTKDKRHWRTALFLGHEIATYSLQSGEKPDGPDQIIDSACLAKPATP